MSSALSEDDAQKIEDWLNSLERWYDSIKHNSHYQESAYCDFEPDDSGRYYLNATIVLQCVRTNPKQDELSGTPAGNEEDRQKTLEGLSLINERPKAVNLLPTRAEAAKGKVIVRQTKKPTLEAVPAEDRTLTEENKPSPAQSDQQETTSNTKARTGAHSELNNDYRPFKAPESSALNRDLLELIKLGSPPADTAHYTLIPIFLSKDRLKQEPNLRSESGRYGIMLRAALLAKITGSKANLSLFINRLEDLRGMFVQAEKLKLSIWQAAAVTRALWRLLDETRLWKLRNESPNSLPVIPVPLEDLPAQLRALLTISAPSTIYRHCSDWSWYRWNHSIPAWVGEHERKLTLVGQIMAFGTFISLVWLSLHSALVPDSGILGNSVSQLIHWRSVLVVDNATIAIALATGAGLVYALTTKRLTLEERVALNINDKIESVLDTVLADLMKANMDVQIGRLGRDEPPGAIPESVARKLDEVFSMKELINSYESTVRARRRHVADEVGKEQRIRAESNQRLRNAGLGVTASFVLFEIGSRIQDHRDLLAGTDPYSFSYWMSHHITGSNTNGNAADSGATTAVTAPKAILDCARAEITEQRPPSAECLDQWRDNALGSSSQLLFLVFLISMLIFFVRISLRDDSKRT